MRLISGASHPFDIIKRAQPATDYALSLSGQARGMGVGMAGHKANAALKERFPPHYLATPPARSITPARLRTTAAPAGMPLKQFRNTGPYIIVHRWGAAMTAGPKGRYNARTQVQHWPASSVFSTSRTDSTVWRLPRHSQNSSAVGPL